jgi:hypothetical protein
MKKMLFAVTISLFAFSFIIAQDKPATPDKAQKAETQKVESAKGCCAGMKDTGCSDMKAGKGCCDSKGERVSKHDKTMSSSEKGTGKTN